MQESWSNFNLQLPDAYLVLSYLITTVLTNFTDGHILSSVPAINKIGVSHDAKGINCSDETSASPKNPWMLIIFGPTCFKDVSDDLAFKAEIKKYIDYIFTKV